MYTNLWWLLVTAGIFLMIMEIFTPGFIIMWFGVSFIIAAIPVYFKAPIEIVIFVYTLSLLFLTIFIRKIMLKYFSGSGNDKKTNTSGIIGLSGIVVEEINPIKSTGSVRVRKELWTAVAENDDVISENSIITVCRIEGVKLIVKKEEDI